MRRGRGDGARIIGVCEQVLQCYFRGIFFGIVDVLPVVPVAGGDVCLVYRDGCRPGCAAAYGGTETRVSEEGEEVEGGAKEAQGEGLREAVEVWERLCGEETMGEN